MARTTIVLKADIPIRLISVFMLLVSFNKMKVQILLSDKRFKVALNMQDSNIYTNQS